MLSTRHVKKRQCFEIISLKFNEAINLEEQKKSMNLLNEIIKDYDGFVSRDYFYSEENGRWIDHLIWSSTNKAKEASDKIMKDPIALKLFSNIDNESMIFSHYNHIGSI